MQKSATDVQVLPLLTAQYKNNNDIGDKANDRNGKHQATAHWLGFSKSSIGLVENNAGDTNKTHRIDQGSQDTDAVIAKSHLMRGRLFRLSKGEPTEQKRQYIDKHVASIAEQSQAIGQVAPHQLPYQDG